MDLLAAAKTYADLHHVVRNGQRYGTLPYTYHLAQVEATLRGFGEDRLALLVAAWLHDVVEDTDITRDDVEASFGAEVAALVWAVTSEPGPNRKARHALTYPKIRGAGRDAIRLKLADRISNVRNGGPTVEMYRKEHAGFRAALFDPDDALNAPMWAELDRLIG